MRKESVAYGYDSIYGQGDKIFAGTWSKEELDILKKMYEEDAYLDDIAMKLRREERSVRNKVHRLGLKRDE